MTCNPIPYQRITEGFHLDLVGGSSATMTFFVPVADLVPFVLSAIGGFQFYQGALTFFIPFVYQRLPYAGFVGLYCNGVDVEPFNVGDVTSGGDFNTWVVTLSFGQPQWPQGDIMDISMSSSAQGYSIESDGQSLFAGGKVIPQTQVLPNKLIPIMELTATYYQQQFAIPAVYWTPFLGTVNLTPWPSQTPFPIGTVLFTGVETQRTLSTDGFTTYTNAFKFSVMGSSDPNCTWNAHWNSKTQSWVQYDPGSESYDFADFYAFLPV